MGNSFWIVTQYSIPFFVLAPRSPFVNIDEHLFLNPRMCLQGRLNLKFRSRPTRRIKRDKARSLHRGIINCFREVRLPLQEVLVFSFNQIANTRHSPALGYNSQIFLQMGNWNGWALIVLFVRYKFKMQKNMLYKPVPLVELDPNINQKPIMFAVQALIFLLVSLCIFAFSKWM